jgi:hypothetical protein
VAAELAGAAVVVGCAGAPDARSRATVLVVTTLVVVVVVLASVELVATAVVDVLRCVIARSDAT